MAALKHGDKKSRIFVQIASYRDTECQWTVDDLFKKAAFPERISVGICWQFIPGDDDDCFQVVTRPNQVRVIKFNAFESSGVTWARNQVQSLWEGEEFTLQIDSHMRFASNWDVKMLQQLDQCASEQPVLSNYPPGYTPPNNLVNSLPSVMVAREFTPKGILHMRASSRPWENGNYPKEPVPGFFCGAGFIFASSKIIEDAPYDPHLYFFGEEITLTVRLWTNGWDFFAPHEVLIWHDWNRKRRPTIHQDQEGKARHRHQKAVLRVRHLLGIEQSEDPEVIKEIEKYGLGSKRSLLDYEKLSDISFSQQKIGKIAMDGVLR